MIEEALDILPFPVDRKINGTIGCEGISEPLPMTGEYHSKFRLGEYGEMLNQTESAKYLGISRKRFRRIAPPPDYLKDDIFPFWSKVTLDNLSIPEDLDHRAIIKRGRACGRFLLGALSDPELRELRRALIDASMGGPSREHTCGCYEQTRGMDLLQANGWLSRHCDCPATPPEVETAIVLQEYGIRIKFDSPREAQIFRDGVLSAIKDYIISKVQKMSQRESHYYIMTFWGGGSYEGLHNLHRPDST